MAIGFLRRGRVLWTWLGIAAALVTLAGSPGLHAQEAPPAAAAPQGPQVDWIRGPGKAPIGSIAEIVVPPGFQFTGQAGTQLLMQAMQNPVDGSELGFLAPSGDADWFIVFEFEDIGYVKDDDKDKLDADAMLDSIRRGTEESNKQRAQRGWSTMSIVGWKQAPRYNQQTNNLEWAILGASDGSQVVNYNTRVLGRNGVMKVNLVTDPEQLPKVLPQLQSLLAGYQFLPGNRYSEFRPGDKVAQYGLAALVTGGAAAVALKSGLLQKFWKLIVLGVVAVGGLVKKLFGGGKSESNA